MITLEATACIAPPSAICADCGCSAAGDTVIVTHEHDALLELPLRTYRHVSAGGCLVARARSEAFWYGEERERAP